VRNFANEVWNRQNYEAATDLYSEKYVNPFGTGPSARSEPIRRDHAAFPDLHLDVDELIVAGDTVVGYLLSRDNFTPP
jgi:predicted ester cyclase